MKAALASGVMLTTAAFGGSSASAAVVTPQAVTCDAYYSIDTAGAHAQVRECHNGSLVRVDGTVTDTDADGQCARVYASYNVYTSVDYSPTACPEGTSASFTFSWRSGSDAYIYLQEI